MKTDREGGSSDFAPYVAPRAVAYGRPGVITWYRVYAVTMPLCYVLALVVWQLAFARPGASSSLVASIALVAVLGAVFAVAALVPYKPWGWTMGLVAICIGLATCLAPAAVLLLVYWFRPETKAAFCRL